MEEKAEGSEVVVKWFGDNNGVPVQPLFPGDLTCHCHTLLWQIKLKTNQVYEIESRMPTYILIECASDLVYFPNFLLVMS